MLKHKRAGLQTEVSAKNEKLKIKKTGLTQAVRFNPGKHAGIEFSHSERREVEWNLFSSPTCSLNFSNSSQEGK